MKTGRSEPPPVDEASASPRPAAPTGASSGADRVLLEGQIASLQRQLIDVSEWAQDLHAETERLRKDVARLQSSRSWRLGQPYRRAARKWESRGSVLTTPALLWLRRLLRRLPLPEHPLRLMRQAVLRHVFGVRHRRTPGKPGNGRPARTASVVQFTPPPPVVTDRRDVFVWGATESDPRTPLAKHVAQELARRGHRVFYVSPVFAESAEPGFEVESHRRTGSPLLLKLNAAAAPPLDDGAATHVVKAQLLAGLTRVLDWTSTTRAVNLVEHPFWLPFAEAIPNQVLVHVGLDTSRTQIRYPSDLLALQQCLSARADLMVATSEQCARLFRNFSHRVVLIPGGGRPDEFSVELLSEQLDGIAMPHVSVVVVSHNNLDLTRRCLDSVEALTQYPCLDVTVVDNASTDGTQSFLQAWASASPGRKCILNTQNLGFAAANNQALRQSAGDYVVLLNNDTVVTAGWLGTLIAHLRRDRHLGLVSAVTNNIDNGARIEIGYSDIEDMHVQARHWTSAHLGQTRHLPSAAFFCIALSRALYLEIGPLDEAFGIGMFEDDDYCRRVELSGHEIACALDVFVHHESAASFDAMNQARRWELFEHNKRLYEDKWGQWPREPVAPPPGERRHRRR
jgi:GT2 family glycosyltransferase